MRPRLSWCTISGCSAPVLRICLASESDNGAKKMLGLSLKRAAALFQNRPRAAFRTAERGEPRSPNQVGHAVPVQDLATGNAIRTFRRRRKALSRGGQREQR